MKFSETEKIARPHLCGLLLLKPLHSLHLHFKAPTDICINICERDRERVREAKVSLEQIQIYKEAANFCP